MHAHEDSTTLPEGFAREAGQLAWDGVSLDELARTYGTPLHVVSHPALARAAARFMGDAGRAGVAHRVFFSVKTNPLVDVLRALRRRGLGAEVSSAPDLWLARRAGHDGQGLVVGGAAMSDAFIETALDAAPALVNVEQRDVLTRLLVAASRRGGRVDVGLRLNPALSRPVWDLLGHTGSKRSHFGFDVDGAELDQALVQLAGSPHGVLRALHVHLGTNLESAKPWRAALPSVVRTWRRALELGLSPTILDVGGGFPAHGAPPPRALEVLRSFVAPSSRRGGAPAGAPVVDEVLSLVDAAFTRAGLPVPEVFVEPGRAITGGAQLLLARVMEVTTTPEGASVAVCDAGALGICPLLLVEQHPVVVVNRVSDDARDVALMGPMPTSLDQLSPSARLPPIERGDVVAVLGTGAYFTSMGTTFAGPRPAIVAIDEGGTVRLVRRRETLEDLVALDVDD